MEDKMLENVKGDRYETKDHSPSESKYTKYVHGVYCCFVITMVYRTAGNASTRRIISCRIVRSNSMAY